jgi:hypothetical protein
MVRFSASPLASIILFISLSVVTRGQNVAPPASTDGLKPCSTETVNGNCYIDIDRRYPVTPPTIQMRKNAKITVNVYHTYSFETLRRDKKCIPDAFAAHSAMSKQALGSEKVRSGLKDVLLGPAQLYEALRARGAETQVQPDA